MKHKLILTSAVIILIVAGIFISKSKPSQAYDKSVCADKLSPTDHCLSDFYTTLVKTEGISAAINDLKQRAAENPMVSSECHPLAHIIGQTASEKFKSVSAAFMQGDAYCWSGYYHGVMEGVVGRIGIENLPQELNTICAEIPGKEKYSFDYYNCVHGLGHGVMETKEDNLFESLSLCDNLTGQWEQQSCQSGVFMENVMVDERFGHSDYLKPNDPMYPCNAVADKYKFECFLGQTSYALKVVSFDYKKIFALCDAEAGMYRDTCNQSMGRDIANQARHVSAQTRDWCYLASDQKDRENCIIGALKEFVSYYHSDKESKEFCGVLDEKDKKMCLTNTAQYYKLF